LGGAAEANAFIGTTFREMVLMKIGMAVLKKEINGR
jgi:hypothetical protein